MSDNKAEAERIERLKAEDIFSPRQVVAIFEALEAAEKRGRVAGLKEAADHVGNIKGPLSPTLHLFQRRVSEELRAKAQEVECQ